MDGRTARILRRRLKDSDFNRRASTARARRHVIVDERMGAVERPTRSALTCHRRPAAAVSYEDSLDFLGLRSAKYWPVTPSTSADEAR
jgi:hypothetical protein